MLTHPWELAPPPRGNPESSTVEANIGEWVRQGRVPPRGQNIGGSKGGARDGPPGGSKFFNFHAVFGKNLKNNSNFGSWCTPLGKFLDPPLQKSFKMDLTRR